MYYVLDENNQAIASTDIKKVAAQIQSADKRRVAEDMIDRYWVSTVFMGVDHSFGGGPPLIFETMIFDTSRKKPLGNNRMSLGKEVYCDRYSTWDEALVGHQKAVEWVMEGCPND